jgi:GNAT superfamily N-acetyltransferase
MTHIHLGHADDAIREASTAINLWTTGPPEECAGSALAVARIDLVTAHLIRSELDAAEHAAKPLLAVAPEQRRRGLGRRLLGAAEARLTSLGARRLQATVVETDPRATAFWCSSGWSEQRARLRFVRG